MQHVNVVSRFCICHTRYRREVRYLLGEEVITCAHHLFTRLLQFGGRQAASVGCSIAPIGGRGAITAARLVFDLRPCNHVKPTLRRFPVQSCVIFKLYHSI